MIPSMHLPLAGFRVLDLTNVLAGPFCCHQLAHLGAEVIKVEVPDRGDLARQLGASPELNEALMGVSFLAQNAGKRSLTLNLKSAQGRGVLERLVESADALVENFRPGVMERLGIGCHALQKVNPRLVYCAISGFGQDGPLKDQPAYDQIVQGLSGVMSITGAADTAPYRVGYPMADTIGGMTAAFAVAAALAARAKDPDTPGTCIDVSMLEAVMATMGWVVSNFLVAGQEPEPLGNENFTASPSGTFTTGDGLLNIAANKQEQFEILCRCVGREDLCADPRFAARQARLEHRHELKAELEQALRTRSAEQWAAELNRGGVPAGCVVSVPQALAHPQIRDRGMIAEFRDVPGTGRDLRVVRTGIKLDGEAPAVDTPPPTLGQHTVEVLREIGYSLREIEILSEQGAL
jgi:formyl-CoA transferase